MKPYFIIICVLLMSACEHSEYSGQQPLYQNEAYALYRDRVVQGEHQATAESREHIVSDYQSPASKTYSRLVKFKFSINEKDNELPPGADHWIIIGEEHESPVVTFGETPSPVPQNREPGFLPPNYEYTFRADMSPVISQFEDQGYYESYNGDRIARSDFKGFYIAGGSEPLTWDFVNLDNRGLQLEETAEENIYAITLTLNPYNPSEADVKSWELSLDVSHKPQYKSDQPIVDALYNLSLEEALKNIEPDSTLRTGAEWGGVWTRDISYSIYLAFAYHEPEIARISLMKKVKRDRIIQDTGSGGAWPVSSDRTTWVLAAWELYKYTGDSHWLRQAYTIIKNTLDDDYKVLYDPQTGLYRGESSFLDWREQTYPKWMDNADIYISENLGTNVIHFQAHRILAQMAQILGEDGHVYATRAQMIKNAINEQLWMPERGFYAQYLYGSPFLMKSPRFEALGEALAVIFGVADEQRAAEIVSSSPVTAFGTTCIYPQIPGIPPYHNNGIWPFVQSYWNLAAARTGNEDVLVHGLASVYRAGALFLTNYENFVAETGDFEGTEINSERMLWSMAGNLAMVHRVFMGMSFESDGIRFHPSVPEVFGGMKTLSNFNYRQATLDITIKGHGHRVASMTLDGELMEDTFLPASITGRHEIVIELDSKPFPSSAIHFVDNHFSLPTPRTVLSANQMQWDPIEGATGYHVFTNGQLVSKVDGSEITIELDRGGSYQVVAIDEQGWHSFASEPLRVFEDHQQLLVQLEGISTPSAFPATNFSGNGFIEIRTDHNTAIDIPVRIEMPGRYYVEFRYANGTGPWNTDNNCAIRSFYADGEYAGVIVFPQRGTDEWSDWGWTNGYFLNLDTGDHILTLSFDPWNVNMDGEINRALIDAMRITEWPE